MEGTAGSVPALLEMRLVVFFTRGMSLEKWMRGGMLEREVALYERLRPHVDEIAFLTYGGPEEEQFAGRLHGIAILPNRWRVPSNLYSVMAPFLHVRTLRRATVFKTNQLNGAWCAAIAKLVYRKPLIVRCGFIWSAFYARLTPSAWKRRLARWVEQRVLHLADRIVVATPADQRGLMARGHDAAKIHVIPNFVDTERFRPMPEIVKESGLLCCIGRLHEQKNPLGLLGALQGLSGVRLVVVGEGPLKPAMERFVREHRLPVEFAGVLPHEQLPALLNRAQLFILPSHFEGHPKALLEAMACGLPVIGTDRPGIRELLTHRENGFLCDPSPASIRAAIQELLGDVSLRDQLAQRARASVVPSCSLEWVVEQERSVLAG